MRISVIVPVYNDEVSAAVLHLLQWRDYIHEIIVVEDPVAVWAKSVVHPKIRVLSNHNNEGKGYSVRRAIKEAEGEVLCVFDADMEYCFSDYVRSIELVRLDKADVVYGSRFVGSGPHRKVYFTHHLANRLLTFLSNVVTGLNLTDMETGHKVMRASFVVKLLPDLRENRFGFEPEITIKLARQGARFYEAGIEYHGRTYAEGKKVRWTDGLRAVWCLVRYAFYRP